MKYSDVMSGPPSKGRHRGIQAKMIGAQFFMLRYRRSSFPWQKLRDKPRSCGTLCQVDRVIEHGDKYHERTSSLMFFFISFFSHTTTILLTKER